MNCKKSIYKDELYSYRKFYNENKKIFYLGLVFSFFCFGFMLTHYMVNIDEETWLLEDSNSWLWLFQNRYGMYIYNFLFTTYGRFVPFFSDVIGILLWNISGFIFSYVFFDFEKKNCHWIRLIMLCYYSSVPLCMGEAFAFTMQVIPESFGMLLTAVAFVCTVKSKLKDKISSKVLITLFLTTALGIYQALICVYVTAIAAWCLCCFLEESSVRQGLLWGIIYCMVSIAVYEILNLAITKAIGSETSFMQNYMGSDYEKGILYVLFMSFANVARVSLGITIDDVYIYGAVPLRILMILFIIISIILFLKEKGWIRKVEVAFFSFGIVIAPFSLYIVMGIYKTHGRTLIALALSGTLEILVIYEMISKQWIEKAVKIVLTGILITHASDMNQIYFYQYLVYQHDKMIANEIMYEIQKLGYDYHSKALVFVGSKEMDEIPILKSGSLGGSFFEWDGGNISRLVDFMELEGYVVNMPNLTQIEEGLYQTKDMKTWPQEGSIIETDNSIVVYLSKPNDKWYITNLGR